MAIPLTREQIDAARADGGGNRVTVGFRPEHTELVSDATGAVPMVVELVEELGSDAYVHGHAKLNGDENSKDTLVVRTDGRTVPQMGELVFVRPREGAHHVFNAETGIRI
jgi:multiple sugar transport system ATP-binding protein